MSIWQMYVHTEFALLRIHQLSDRNAIELVRRQRLPSYSSLRVVPNYIAHPTRRPPQARCPIFTDLSNELHLDILQYLPPPDLGSFLCVIRHLYARANDYFIPQTWLLLLF